MKNIIIASLIAASSGLAAAPQASAKNEGLAALGGFIGGVVVGAALDHGHNRPDYRPGYRVDYRNDYRVPAPAYCPPPVCEPQVVRYAPPVPQGYWQDVQVKTWVPECWVMGRDRWGRPVRVLQPGYYTYSTNRQWVSCG
jgi:hypothetical protein